MLFVTDNLKIMNGYQKILFDWKLQTNRQFEVVKLRLEIILFDKNSWPFIQPLLPDHLRIRISGGLHISKSVQFSTWTSVASLGLTMTYRFNLLDIDIKCHHFFSVSTKYWHWHWSMQICIGYPSCGTEKLCWSKIRLAKTRLIAQQKS